MNARWLRETDPRCAIARELAAVKSGNRILFTIVVFQRCSFFFCGKSNQNLIWAFRTKSLCASCTTGATIVNQMTHFSSRARSPGEAHIKSGRRCASVCCEEKRPLFHVSKSCDEKCEGKKINRELPIIPTIPFFFFVMYFCTIRRLSAGICS